jgi:hypothetical protein
MANEPENNDGGAAGGEGAGGSAADFLPAGAGAGGAAAGAGEAGAGAGAEGGAAEGQGAGAASVSDEAFLALLSADGGDASNPSNRDWAKATGIKDIDSAIALLRENQKAARDSGRVKIPGENATPEERAAYHKAIGVPEKVEDYSFAAPEGVQLNEGLTKVLATAALESGVPKAAFDNLASKFIAAQLDDMNAERTRLDGEAEGWATKQGDKLDAQLAHVNAAVRGLSLSPEDNSKLRSALGPARALDILSKLGAGMAEDVMLTGGKGRFGVTPAEAQAEMNRLKTDPDFHKKVLVKGSSEQMRWNRLQDAVGSAADQAAKAA